MDFQKIWAERIEVDSIPSKAEDLDWSDEMDSDEFEYVGEEDEETDGDSSSTEEEDDYPIVDPLLFINAVALDSSTVLNKSTNVIFLTGEYPATMKQYRKDWNYGPGNMGPDCHLCHQEIFDESEPCAISETVHTIVDMQDVLEDMNSDPFDKNIGVMQCNYCFNVYHRFKCSLSMSKTSYLISKWTKQWSCPTCVPEFIPCSSKSTKGIQTEATSASFKLEYIFKRILSLMRKYDPVYACVEKVAEHFQDLITMKLDILYEIG